LEWTWLDDLRAKDNFAQRARDYIGVTVAPYLTAGQQASALNSRHSACVVPGALASPAKPV